MYRLLQSLHTCVYNAAECITHTLLYVSDCEVSE